MSDNNVGFVNKSKVISNGVSMNNILEENNIILNRNSSDCKIILGVYV